MGSKNSAAKMGSDRLGTMSISTIAAPTPEPINTPTD